MPQIMPTSVVPNRHSWSFVRQNVAAIMIGPYRHCDKRYCWLWRRLCSARPGGHAPQPFLARAAKKPRTVCGAQLIASAAGVPLALRGRLSMVHDDIGRRSSWPEGLSGESAICVGASEAVKPSAHGSVRATFHKTGGRTVGTMVVNHVPHMEPDTMGFGKNCATARRQFA
jgi:hypothetical protein